MDKELQLRCLAFLLTHEKYLAMVAPTLREDTFESEPLQAIYKTLKAMYRRVHRLPTRDEFITKLERVTADKTDIVRSYWCKLAYRLYEIETTDSTWVEFGDHVSRREVAHLAGEMYSSGPGELKPRLQKTIDILAPFLSSGPSEGHVNPLSLEYMQERVLEVQEKPNRKITLGFKTLDVVTQGGLEPGEMMIVLAPSGCGKSTFIMNMAIAQVQAGYRTGFISMDNVRSVMDTRLYAHITKKSMNEMVDYQEQMRAIGNWANNMGLSWKELATRYLYEDLLPRRTTVPQVKMAIERMQEQYGKVDTVFVDYGDLLRPDVVREQEWLNQQAVFADLAALAKELDVLVISPTQGTREAEKFSRNEEKKTFGMYHTGGSIHKVDAASLQIGIQQTLPQRKMNPMVASISIPKNRHGPHPAIPMIWTGETATFEEDPDPQARTRFEDQPQEEKKVGFASGVKEGYRVRKPSGNGKGRIDRVADEGVS